MRPFLRLVDEQKSCAIWDIYSWLSPYNPQVSAVHRLYVPLDIAGVLYRVKLTAKTFIPELGKGKVLHALAAVKIENAPLGTLLAHGTPKAPKPQAQPTTERTVSIAELLAGAILFNNSPFMMVKQNLIIAQ